MRMTKHNISRTRRSIERQTLRADQLMLLIAKSKRIARRRLRACGLLLAALACTPHQPGAVATPPPAGVAREIADRVSFLTTAVITSRARLDSAVLELHRVSGDTSPPAVARLRQLRKRAISLDSAYRETLAEFQWTVNAATAGSITSNSRYPVDAAPAPLVRGFPDGSNWMIQSHLIHEVGTNSPYIVIVPRGFVTDFASIPQPLQLLRGRLSTTGRYGNAAVVHDYLYWRQDCTRAQADNILAIAMKDAGVSLLERKIIYEAVRQFGQSAWDGNRSARQAGMIRTVAPPNDLVPMSGTWDEYREWLRTTRAKEGLEYRVPKSVCAAADSISSN